MGRRVIIGDTGYSFITAEWAPEPTMEAQALLRLSEALDDWTEPMGEARAIIRENIRRRFETETDPDGKPWQELSEGYKFRKLRSGYPEDILYREGRLYDAAVSGEALQVDEREILFDPSGLPEYGAFHQEGLPDRQAPLPQREFIGVDDEAGDEIEAYFAFWLNRTTETYYPSDLGKWHTFAAGDIVSTTRGLTGTFTGIAGFGGGTLVRGEGGRFIGVTHESGSFF